MSAWSSDAGPAKRSGSRSRHGFPALQQSDRGLPDPSRSSCVAVDTGETAYRRTHSTGATMTDVVITAAKRTPVGAFLGAFAATPAHELGRVAIEAALAQSGVAAEEVSEVILGQVLTAAQGQNPARQASMAAGIPKEIPAWGLNQVCGSGLRAVALAARSEERRVGKECRSRWSR